MKPRRVWAIVEYQHGRRLRLWAAFGTLGEARADLVPDPTEDFRFLPCMLVPEAAKRRKRKGKP